MWAHSEKFLDMTPRSLVATYECFGGTYCLHLQSKGLDSDINQMTLFTVGNPSRDTGGQHEASTRDDKGFLFPGPRN
jgi:hypothetical protein